MPTSHKKDSQLRSKEPWEALGKRKGNPYFSPKVVTDKNGVKRKVYVKRKRDRSQSNKGGNMLSDL